ncbi:uncharacterized protein RCC_06594 [Ramularia collo-cygni]|uniref:Uncharacterized protein n=1 Tax=Ramularia collo-cygni TaxID=112498 RepID=A0A2D3VAP7_9PEZI|nr:uncharacterized protein RCC_06594 [Ramularia collo-cygni]CZT20736.1 uncharacterized protein RCC_06594 [Ramularia collo-cygni]
MNMMIATLTRLAYISLYFVSIYDEKAAKKWRKAMRLKFSVLLCSVVENVMKPAKTSAAETNVQQALDEL